ESTHGRELWKSNGTAAGTVLVKDINLPGGGGSIDSSPAELTNVAGTLFFRALETNGIELWRSDGTAGGTKLVKNIAPSNGWSTPDHLTNVAGTLFFSADDQSTYGRELWKSDGTAAGTKIVKDISSGAGGASTDSSPAELTNVAGTLFFRAGEATNGIELWSSNGTAAGTKLVKNIAPSNGWSTPDYLTNAAGTLFFTADDQSTYGRELWKAAP
ncbi:MAG: hypothetical protein AABM42_02470, partial [Actinomycetota bacterium]